MVKQKVFFSGTVLAIFLSLSNVSLTSGLDKNIQSPVKSMSIPQSSSDKLSLSNVLEMMDKFVDSSMNIIPEKVDANDKVSVDNYKEELEKLQHEINIAKKKVEGGNIGSLRESLDKMNDVKLEGHRKFR